MVDANILVAGIGWPRFSYEVLQHAFTGDFKLVLSPKIIEEARNSAAHAVSSRAYALDTYLANVDFEVVETPSDEIIAQNSALVRDTKDVHVALAAIAAKVDCLISQDRDLTEPGEPIHQHVLIMLPGTFLREYMGWTSEQLEAIRYRTWQDLADE